MAKRPRMKQNKKRVKDSIPMAFVAVFLLIIGFFIAILTQKNDKYIMYYAKQSLVLTIVAVMAGFISAITTPLLGLGIIFGFIFSAIIFILWVIAWANALSGEEKETPLIGKYATYFKF